MFVNTRCKNMKNKITLQIWEGKTLQHFTGHVLTNLYKDDVINWYKICYVATLFFYRSLQKSFRASNIITVGKILV